MAVTTRNNPVMFGMGQIPEVGQSLPRVGVTGPVTKKSPFPMPSSAPIPIPLRAAVRHPPQWNKFYNETGAAVPLDLRASTITAEELGPRAVNFVRQVSRLPLSERYEQAYTDDDGDVWIWSHVYQKFQIRYNISESHKYKEHKMLIDQPVMENARASNPTSGPLGYSRIYNPSNVPDPGVPRQMPLVPPPALQPHRRE